MVITTGGLIAVDGRISAGNALVNEASITGEGAGRRPRQVRHRGGRRRAPQPCCRQVTAPKVSPWR
ncbi:hypothetical protein JTF08_10805 [Micrococcaceae bacterium RIT802]|nr:hypothetical protein [Micrococcaceae bacterium RIT 802]